MNMASLKKTLLAGVSVVASCIQFVSEVQSAVSELEHAAATPECHHHHHDYHHDTHDGDE